MGTRSRVAVMHGDVCKSVYCHYDGYLEYTGEILNEHYNSVLANELISRGDNSGVKETPADMNFYRERGEEDAEWQVAHTFEEFLEQVENCGAEYYYIMSNEVWYVGAMYDVPGLIKRGLVPLTEALQRKIAEEETLQG